jgi:hypothetical protein
MVLELADTGLPVGADCQASAQNTSEVTSGGGGLGGASVALGPVSPAGSTDFDLLPGVYDVLVLCTAGESTWQAVERSVSIRRDHVTNVRLEPSQEL